MIEFSDKCNSDARLFGARAEIFLPYRCDGMKPESVGLRDDPADAAIFIRIGAIR